MAIKNKSSRNLEFIILHYPNSSMAILNIWKIKEIREKKKNLTEITYDSEAKPVIPVTEEKAEILGRIFATNMDWFKEHNIYLTEKEIDEYTSGGKTDALKRRRVKGDSLGIGM